MPADLKKVAREIAYKCTEVVESRLQTLVAEVRAQAMEEAAKICDHETAYQSQYAHGIAREPMRAMGHVISEVIRRRASGNSGKD
jgi:vacuolar-type H+-ATPase subunit H